MHDIYCGGIKTENKSKTANVLNLDIYGDDQNINLKIDDISHYMMSDILDELKDLIEIAAYVYCADQKIKRSGETLNNMAESWFRNMHFHIPVRCLDKWQSPTLQEPLQDCLGFLSDDNYHFTFYQKEPDLRKGQSSLLFDGREFKPHRVSLFSGGLDSFAGTINDIVSNHKKLVLVSHYPCPQIYSLQKILVKGIKEKGYEKNISYVPVVVNKKNIKSESFEYTQRTRSFLFASLGISIAQMFNQDKICFYENGVVSLNLPISNDVLGARATRTTHPKVMRGLEELFSSLLEKDITIETPLKWQTKAEVIKLIEKNSFGEFIGKTNSCTRPHIWTKKHTHCGVCSQCIDRRFSILAAGMNKYDSASQYRCDLMLGNRDKGRDITMATRFVAFAQNISELTMLGFQKEYPQIFNALEYYDEVAPLPKIYDMLQRHASGINNVITREIERNSNAIAKGELPEKCLLSMCITGSKKIELTETPSDTDQLAEFIDSIQESICEFVVDEANHQIIFSGGLTLSGTEYTLIKLLLPNFLYAKNNQTEPKPIDTEKLIQELFGHKEDSFRKMVSRLNLKINEHLGVSMGVTFGNSNFIENVVNIGYRINKDAKLIRSIGDLQLHKIAYVTS